MKELISKKYYLRLLEMWKAFRLLNICYILFSVSNRSLTRFPIYNLECYHTRYIQRLRISIGNGFLYIWLMARCCGLRYICLGWLEMISENKKFWKKYLVMILIMIIVMFIAGELIYYYYFGVWLWNYITIQSGELQYQKH